MVAVPPRLDSEIVKKMKGRIILYNIARQVG